MLYVKIWVHLVFSTKERIPFISKDIRNEIYQHIIQNCKSKNIFLQSINGHDEHIHCLISLGKDQTISKIAQLIKGESSFWVNKHNICQGKFAWQDDYFAVSVSESQVESVISYIKNQEIHHLKRTFAEEVDEFMRKYGFQWVKDVDKHFG